MASLQPSFYMVDKLAEQFFTPNWLDGPTLKFLVVYLVVFLGTKIK